MRTRRAVAVAAGVSTVLLAYYVISWAQVTQVRERGTDFSASYVAALLLRSGDGAELYDQQAEHARHLTLLPAGTVINLPFITPPTTALVALPFTALDPGTAFRAWSLLQLALLALAVWIAIRAGPWPEPRQPGRAPVLLMAIAGGGTFAFLLLGQIDAIPALGLAAAYASFRWGRSAGGGFWLGLAFAATKPHLAVGLAVWLIARRDWRALAGAIAGCATVGAVSLALVGPSGVGGFLSALGFAYGNTPGSSTLGIPGLVASWLGGGAAAGAVGLTGSVAALGGCAVLGSRSRRGGALELSLAGAAALSLLASPHLLPHDLVILAPVFAWCATLAAAADGSAWPGAVSLRVAAAWAILGAVTFIDTGNAAPAPPGRLVPLALIGIGVAALILSGSAAPAGSRPARVALAQSGGSSGAGGSTA